jgi:N-acetylneuraminic acid mutarotase
MKKGLLLLVLIMSNLSFAQLTNSWTKKSDFGGLKRERAVAFEANGYGFVGTGIDTAEIVHKDFWRYDASNDTWSQVADLPGSVRRNAIAFSINDEGYVGTGINAVTSSEVGAMKLSDMWKYNPITNQWSAIAPYPGNSGQGIYFSTAFAVDGRGYVVGGKHGPNNYSNRLYMYNPATDQWYLGPNFPGGVRYQLSSFSVYDKGYVGLGTDQDMYRKDWWEYKPANNTWTQKADLPGSERSTAATFTIGARGYVCMGTNGGVLDDLYEYNPGNNTWTARANYGGSPRKGPVAFVINNRAYVGTGKGNSGKKASMHEYNPILALGISDLNNSISVYPNPATDVININASEPIETLQLMNVHGQIVSSSSWTNQLDVQQLKSGIYYLVGISNGATVGNKKIFIQ